MKKPSILLDFGLLKTNAAFRAVFCARFISILALGLMAIAIPVQIQALTGSTLLVGLAVTLAGSGMFAGLLMGGVLADRYERRRLILFARSTCGVGFVGLCLNAALPAPSLTAIYLLAVWDGFFGAVGVTALLAATPALVGRENIVQAGAISMLTVRFGSILSPAIGGAVIASAGVAWNYGLAALGTLLTLLPLLRLPQLPPPPQPREHPLRALIGGFTFLLQNKVIGMVALIGALLTMASAVRVLYPAISGMWNVSIAHLGFMYAAVPLGATIGAFTSGRIAQVARPGWVMLLTAIAAFAAIGLFGLMPWYGMALLCLVVFGYFSALNSLLQYGLIQNLTPDAFLGRINGLWTAQNVVGDAIGALLLGAMGAFMLPAMTSTSFGFGAVLLAVVLAFAMRGLRQVGSGGLQPATEATEQ
ncbi:MULTISPECIES: enterobactin transporter EntS [unclassified Serratia (in: enterobacteria)]|uniref:enterobactin transporter EntS n=1 Tax=unclassified Serratia (in: enterobacteria) TaxID=2647522 RepID=UPI000500A016|nr:MULTISPECIES: enterobactin transporter EntS [unclassified Serratia (in: enterobacteria)]KFK92818.1 enterobactin exporter EntS [Serratia sp. Ag2]KFK94029.1 enterobactin exporter EntS [Serratia sp. Ag1]